MQFTELVAFYNSNVPIYLNYRPPVEKTLDTSAKVIIRTTEHPAISSAKVIHLNESAAFDV
jgi:hypothetical protein